jgi:hypothetical protein
MERTNAVRVRRFHHQDHLAASAAMVGTSKTGSALLPRVCAVIAEHGQPCGSEWREPCGDAAQRACLLGASLPERIVGPLCLLAQRAYAAKLRSQRDIDVDDAVDCHSGRVD